MCEFNNGIMKMPNCSISVSLIIFINAYITYICQLVKYAFIKIPRGTNEFFSAIANIFLKSNTFLLS
jgi:hypothetical protein